MTKDHLNLSTDNAQDSLFSIDDCNEAYHYFSKKTWGDRNHYDLCLNTAELGYEKAAEILAAAAK